MDRPTVLIVGGDDKKLPFANLVTTIANHPQIKKIIFLGCRNIPDFVKALTKACPQKIHTQVFSMAEAVEEAATLAVSGDNVLLSPGFTSFDLFQNEFDRGRQFNDCVAALTS